MRYKGWMIKLDRKFYKKAAAVFTILAIISAGIIFWITAHYKHVIKKKLPEWVAASTDSVYTISYKDVSINVFTHSITIKGLKLRYDTTQIKRLHERHEAYKNYFSIYIPEIEIENIAWTKSIEHKELTCDGIYISRPYISIFHAPWLSDSSRIAKKKETRLKRLYATVVKIKHAHSFFKNLDPGDNSIFRSDDCSVVLKDWEYKPGGAKDTNSFAFAREGSIYLWEISYEKPGMQYSVRASSLYFSSINDSMRIGELKIYPSVDTNTFYKQIGHQADMFHFFFPSIACTGLDWQKFTMHGAFVSKKVTINNAVISDYFSRIPPRNTENKYGKFPHQLLQKLKLPIFVENVSIISSTLRYTELNNITKIPATLSFDELQGNFNNVTNMPEYLSINPNCIINLQGKFMNQFDMAARLNLMLTDTAGAFSASSYLTGLHARAITKQVQALALVNIKTFYGSRLEFTMQGNEEYASAKMTMLYQDLKIKLQKLSKDSTRLKNKALISFFANYSLLLQSNPMPGQNVRVINTYIKRTPDQSFFNLIWKNILQGIFKTIAQTEETAKMMELQANAVTRKPPAERPNKGFLKRLFRKKYKDRQ